MRNKISLAALLAATCLTTPVVAADMAVKAPPVAAPIPYSDWSGIYVGLEAGYGWGHNSFDPFGTVEGFGGAGNIANILNGVGSGILFPAFTFTPFSSFNNQGWLAGGFAGAQKQWGSWVLGLEADFDAADINHSVALTSVQHDVLVSSFQFGQVPVITTTDPNQTRVGTGIAAVLPVTITIPGQTITSTGTITIPGQTITSTGSIVVPGQTVTSTGDVTIPGQTVQACVSVPVIGQVCTGASLGPASLQVLPQTVHVTVSGSTADATILVSVNGTTIPVTVPVSVTGSTVATTVTVPGQSAAVTVVTPVSGITASGFTVGNPVLQQFQDFATVTRTLSIQTKIDELGSLRGKAGFTPAPDWLIYGTGGLAWAHASSTVTALETLDFGGEDVFHHTVTSHGNGTMLGWAVGAGVDWKHQIDPGSAIVLGLEYLHYDFPKNFGLGDGGGATFTNNHTTVDAVKGRVSWLFNIH
jgi:opacity protein-like surface antigen